MARAIKSGPPPAPKRFDHAHGLGRIVLCERSTEVVRSAHGQQHGESRQRKELTNHHASMTSSATVASGVNLTVPRRASEPFGYCVEGPPAFSPRTHAAMIFQSGSSWDLNCLPPWWVSARPPTSGASGISSNGLVSGLPGVTSFETI